MTTAKTPQEPAAILAQYKPLSAAQVDALRCEWRDKYRDPDPYGAADHCRILIRFLGEDLRRWSRLNDKGKAMMAPEVVPHVQERLARLVELLPELRKAIDGIGRRRVPAPATLFLRYAGGPRQSTAIEALLWGARGLVSRAYDALLDPDVGTRCAFPDEHVAFGNAHHPDYKADPLSAMSSRVLADGFTPAALSKLAGLAWTNDDADDEMRALLAAEQLAAEQLAGEQPKNDADKDRPWDESAEAFIPESKAVEMSKGTISLSKLSKMLTPDGRIRYMRKSGQRCRVHAQDFLEEMRRTPGNKSDAEEAARIFGEWKATQKEKYGSE